MVQWWCVVCAFTEFGCSLQFLCVAFVLTELGAWCNCLLGLTELGAWCNFIALGVWCSCLLGCVDYAFAAFGALCNVFALSMPSHAQSLGAGAVLLRCLCPHSVWYVVQSWCVDYALAEFILSCLYVLVTQYGLR